jgi:hypothetical protein
VRGLSYGETLTVPASFQRLPVVPAEVGRVRKISPLALILMRSVPSVWMIICRAVPPPLPLTVPMRAVFAVVCQSMTKYSWFVVLV